MNLHIFFYITATTLHCVENDIRNQSVPGKCLSVFLRILSNTCVCQEQNRLSVLKHRASGDVPIKKLYNEAQTNTQALLPPTLQLHSDNVWVKIDPACTPSWVKPTRTDNNWYVWSSGHWQTHLQSILLYLATFALTGDISCGFITVQQIPDFICIDHRSLSTSLSSMEPHFTSVITHLVFLILPQ